MKRAATLALVAVITVGCEGASPAAGHAQSAPAPPARASTTIDGSRRTAITNAVERVAPSVVTVQVETKSAAPVDIFEMMFGGRSGERVQASMGSGFIIRDDGVVVTNAHVVNGATTVSVAMRDGATFDARVVGTDELNDIAVLRIDARGMPVAPLGNSGDVIVGEWAIAIGNPFGFVLGNAEPSVTAGVISGTGRNLLAPSAGGTGTYDMIQTDAAINPGNSGGPLVNALGEVIGMNTLIYTPSQGSVGLGFAVPINRVKRIADDLIAHGTVRRPWVGVKLKDPSANNPREAIALGAVVASVVPASPAAEAGLQPGDQILRAGTQSVRNFFTWESVQLDLRVGDRVPMHIKRGTTELDVTVRVADQPEFNAAKVEALKDLQLISLTPAIRGEHGIRSTSGAYVYDLPESLSGVWNVQKGDVIVRVGDLDITDAESVRRAFTRYKGAGPFYVVVERGARLYRVAVPGVR
jgi:serine protease Do